MRLPLALLSLAALVGATLTPNDASAPVPRWWKGNTHTHTLWSDGDAAPDLVVDWYASRDYDFLVLTDHNQLQVGERWFPVAEGSRLTSAHVEDLRKRFGAENVSVRDGAERQELRLATLEELEARFAAPGDFILIPGEEITSHFTVDEQTKLPVHINGVNLTEYVPPRGGDSVVDILNETMAVVAAQAEAAGRPILAHLNHPNFGWGVTWEDVARMRHERFFEVYNGHHSVRNEGDETRPSTERMWDLANTLRATELDLPLLYGVATDDAHNYHGNRVSQPGRGWVMVRSESLGGDAVVAAMERGDFYASSGVVLEDVGAADGEYRVVVAAEADVVYTTRFFGTRRTAAGVGPAGELLLETTANPAVYPFTGDELFVRAVVESSRAHPNPYREGDQESAWAQPARP